MSLSRGVTSSQNKVFKFIWLGCSQKLLNFWTSASRCFERAWIYSTVLLRAAARLEQNGMWGSFPLQWVWSASSSALRKLISRPSLRLTLECTSWDYQLETFPEASWNPEEASAFCESLNTEVLECELELVPFLSNGLLRLRDCPLSLLFFVSAELGLSKDLSRSVEVLLVRYQLAPSMALACAEQQLACALFSAMKDRKFHVLHMPWSELFGLSSEQIQQNIDIVEKELRCQVPTSIEQLLKDFPKLRLSSFDLRHSDLDEDELSYFISSRRDHQTEGIWSRRALFGLRRLLGNRFRKK